MQISKQYIQNNIYINNINNKKNIYSSKLKIEDNSKSLKNQEEINNGKLQEVKNEFYDDIILDGIYELDKEGKKIKSISVDKFFTNLSNVYANEKSKIEPNFTGKEKDEQLNILNERYNHTLKDFTSSFTSKVCPSSLNMVFSGMKLPKEISNWYNEVEENLKKLGEKTKHRCGKYATKKY